MDVMQFAPGAVIGVAIAITELLKKYIRKEIMDKIVWVPPLVVGIIGAILLDWGKAWNIVAWDAICYAAISCFTVLVVKRTIK